MQKWPNLSSRIPAKKRFAALMSIVDIANRLDSPGGKPRPVEVALPAMVRALRKAQQLAHTPEDLRIGDVELEWSGDVLSSLIVYPASPVPTSYRVPPDVLFRDAESMRAMLWQINFAGEAGQRWHSPLVITRRTLLDLSPDFTIVPCPELFGETLLRVLAFCDVRRIRYCPRCERLFVQLRVNQTGCSPECSSRERARRFLADPSHSAYYTRGERRKRERRKQACENHTKTKKQRVSFHGIH